MTKVTIIGATGSLGRAATEILLNETDAELTLFSRSADRLAQNPRITKIAADINDMQALTRAILGADVVFVALSGDLPHMAAEIISAMNEVGAKRLIFITSYGIYGELPGQNGEVAEIILPYREAADKIEASNLDYTILRPGWFDNSPDRSYQLIPKGEIIYANNISRLAIADFVKKVVLEPEKYIKQNLGMVRD
ncbi:MAG: NAD(P)H-binding protein [bacterium]|nr:NAD(P)H-binding protein [bacterium]